MNRKRIWVPDHSMIPLPDRPLVLHMPSVGIAGFVYLDLIDGATGRIKEHLEFPNILTNALLEGIGSGSFVMSDFHNNSYHGVGTGNAAPTVDDTQLQSQTNPRTNDAGGFGLTSGFQSGSTYPASLSGSYWWVRTTRVFTETQATGSLTEFGVFNASSGPTMGVRTLLKDATGTPTTIVKSNTDQLRTIHEMRFYPPTELDVVSGTVVIAATSYSFTASAINFSNSSNWGMSFGFPAGGIGNNLGNWISNNNTLFRACDTASIVNPTGSESDFVSGFGQEISATSMSVPAYISASHYRDILVEWKPSVANFAAGIKGFVFSMASTNFLTQLVVNPPILKTDVQRLRVSFRMHFDRKTFS